MNGETRQIAVKLDQVELETVLRLVGHSLRDPGISATGRERIRDLGEKALQALYEFNDYEEE